MQKKEISECHISLANVGFCRRSLFAIFVFVCFNQQSIHGKLISLHNSTTFVRWGFKVACRFGLSLIPSLCDTDESFHRSSAWEMIPDLLRRFSPDDSTRCSGLVGLSQGVLTTNYPVTNMKRWMSRIGKIKIYEWKRAFSSFRLRNGITIFHRNLR